jgi:hypothetical protein
MYKGGGDRMMYDININNEYINGGGGSMGGRRG